MEDYKQKYEDALETARKINNGEGVAAPKGWSMLEVIFPELRKSKDELMREELIHFLETCRDPRLQEEWVDWLEKQGKQEQLYIRFGEIPFDEKSKIYQGEIEVGTENGVSVYPAFKTNEGDIVLGLNLPITKTTLYTQQHLLEYDDRPCYLIKGTYVGKDTDGQPLINNISIIEKIDSYRVKEEKQNEKNPIKVESKFKVGDRIVHNNTGDVCQVTEIKDDKYCIWPLYAEIEGYLSFIDVDNDYHLWTIYDAKDGDILTTHLSPEGDWIGIFKESTEESFTTHCFLASDGEFVTNINLCKQHGTYGIHPATKEQRDLLFQKMKEAGYEWNTEKKELKRIESKSSWSEEDKNTFASLCTELPFIVYDCYLEDVTKYIFWLETLKQRLNGTK